jgi:SPP1 gp7 family putative phage head morphogenesis protein
MTIENVLTRRQVFNQRFAGGEAIAAENILKRIYAKINERLLRDPTEFQQLNMTRIRNDINNILAIDLDDMKGEILDGALDFAEAEGEFIYTALSSETSVILALPAIEQIKQAVVQAGMDVVVGSGTLTINEALDKFAVNKGVEIRAAINDGILTGQTNQQIAAQIKDYGDNLHKGQINALVRTSINNASTQARRIVTEENQNILKGDEWIATLDSRTTLICGGRDGNIYPINSGPFPPAHWNACCEGVLITTDRGDVPIEDVKVGDYAMTHTGKFKRVYAVMAKPHKGKVVRLTNNFGQSVRLTNDHPILTSIGYQAAGKVPKVANSGIPLNKVFNYAHKFKRLKRGIFISLVKQAILSNSHNIKTQVSDSLVSYNIGSFTAGVSSSIKLNKDVTNSKICNIITCIILMFKRYFMLVKKINHKTLVKCRVLFKRCSK